MATRLGFLAVVLVFALAACGEKKGLSVSEVRPTKGPYIGGEPVTITGSGFNPTQGVKIYFGGKKASNPVIESETQIRVEPPGGEAGQLVDILIVFDEGKQITVPKAYTYIDPVGKAGPAKW